MQNLKDYINESRDVIGKLSFDEELFINFMEDSIIDSKYDESEFWDLIKSNIEQHYNPKVWSWFVGWCESYLLIQNKITLSDFYKQLSLTPLDRIKRILGAGSNGIVLNVDKNTIIKIFYGDHIKKCDEPFIKYCHIHSSKVFPKVYKIGKNWCTMEKLQIKTPKCRKLLHLIDDTNIQGKSIYDWVKEKNVDRYIFNDEELWAYDWCMQCKKEMELIHSSYITWPGDLDIKNIGERENGDIIFFDI